MKTTFFSSFLSIFILSDKNKAALRFARIYLQMQKQFTFVQKVYIHSTQD